VDFFWNVGSPDTEIDHLNDIGALINPSHIGCWVEISHRSGMDGGWCFPITMKLNLALCTLDGERSKNQLQSWANQFMITECNYLSHDMGAEPPRRTEFHFNLKNFSFEKQMEIIKSAFKFSALEIPEDFMNIILMVKEQPLILTFNLTGEEFVKLGVLLPDPTMEQVNLVSGENRKTLTRFERTMEVKPCLIEGVSVNKNWSYIFNEGWNVYLHYKLTETTSIDYYIELAAWWPSTHLYLSEVYRIAIIELYVLRSTRRALDLLPSDLMRLIIYWMLRYWFADNYYLP